MKQIAGCQRIRLVLVAMALVGLSGEAATLCHAQTGRWSGSIGVAVAGDPDEPYSGGSGAEFTLWFVINKKTDFGLRASLLSFDSEGMVFSEPPQLVPGQGDIVPLEIGFRFYPAGSDRTWFPFIGVAAVVPLSDSFDSEPVDFGGEVGLVLDSDWEIDSVGASVEAGLRWDVSERWFVEIAARYVALGAETIGTVEVAPVTSDTRAVQTDLDSTRLAFAVGAYF